MTFTFNSVDLTHIRDTMCEHLVVCASPIDSFLEAHILRSTHYEILIAGEAAGYTSIHKGSLITQFSLFPRFRKYGQAIFAEVKKLEYVQSAFVQTGDEFFLSHVLDNHRQLAMQAYFFQVPDTFSFVESPYKLVLATSDDAAFITEQSGDFFGDLLKHIERQELFLMLRDGQRVGFGVVEKGSLLPNVSSIGMFVIEKFRKQGVGTAIISALIEHCRKQNLRPVAGCGYYNHASKKTLERAGMFTQSRLLKISF